MSMLQALRRLWRRYVIDDDPTEATQTEALAELWTLREHLPAGAKIGRSPAPGMFAIRHEQIVCDGEDQHAIARFTRSVRIGDPFERTALGFWHQPEPRMGERIGTIKCTRCGASWWLPGNHMRFRDGWR